MSRNNKTSGNWSDDTLLITGGGGFIGGHLALRACSDWKVFATYHRKKDPAMRAIRLLPIELTDLESVRSAFRYSSPTVVVHSGAITNMDYCYEHADLAMAVNTKGTENIATACEETGAHMIYISTDLVFDGTGSYYKEEDQPNPICIYGQTKLAGEKAMLSKSSSNCIVRTAWTYGKSVNASRCFAERMIETMSLGTMVTLFTDEYRTPIYVTNLCNAILGLARRHITGTFHLAGAQRISRYEFGLLTAGAFGFDSKLISKATIDSYGFKDFRPRDCSLSNRKAIDSLLLKPLSIRESLREMVC
jgi:dTDP-4-dehydrorhamnose reductase